MTRRWNPRGEEHGRRRARDAAAGGGQEAQLAAWADAARRGDPKAHALLWAHSIRQLPPGPARDQQALELGQFLQDHDVQPVIRQVTVEGPLVAPAYGKRRVRARVTYGFDPRFARQHLRHQEPHFSDRGNWAPRQRSVAAGELERVFPWWPNVTRWHLADEYGTSMHYLADALYLREHAATEARGGPLAPGGINPTRGLEHRILWGTLPGDTPSLWNWLLHTDTPAATAYLLNDRLPRLQALFLGDLFVYGLAAFPDDLAAMPDQGAFIRARRYRRETGERQLPPDFEIYEQGGQ